MAEPGMKIAAVAGQPAMGVDPGGNAQHLKVAADGSLITTLAANAGGAVLTTAVLLSSLASTNGTNVKATPGRIFLIHGRNNSASTRYLKLYDLATTPSVGTTAPKKTFEIPGNSVFSIDWGDTGYSFSAGIGFGLTTGSANADTGAIGAGDITCLNIDYE